MRENLISKRHPNKMSWFILFYGLWFIRTSVRSVPYVGLSQRVSVAQIGRQMTTSLQLIIIAVLINNSYGSSCLREFLLLLFSS
jgi:hypothetical protein